jgi:hypothetical protein
VSGGSFAFTNANAGNGDKTVTVSAATVNDGNGGGNYNVSYVSNTASTITPANLTVSTSNVTKTYDGTLAASGTATVVSGTLFQNVSNGNAPDNLSGGTFAFTDPNAGAGDKTVTASGVTVNDGNGGANYAVSYVDNTTSTISRALLTFAGTIAERAYDGTTLATLATYSLTGLVGNQTVTASPGTATFADRNAGTAKTVTIGGITLANGTNGGLASNYFVNPSATAVGIIDPKVLTLIATIANKVYDGTTLATLLGYSLSGFVGSETVTGASSGSASFLDKNVGTGKAVAITGISLQNGTNGGLAANYAVPTSAASSADITPATLHVAGVVAVNKVYDGTLTAILDTQAAVLTGVFGNDNVSVSSITGTFLTKDVGTNKPIDASTSVLSGADAYDYTLVQPTGLSANITPRSLTVSATGLNKVYDGSTAAIVTLTDNRIAGDVLTVTSDDAFLDKNVGTSKFISVSDIVISGTDAFDYTVNTNTAASADITKANLIVGAVGVNKVYDSTVTATVILNDTPLANDSVQASYGSAVYTNKNVGTGKTVNVGDIVLSGADAGNYNANLSTTTTADITPAALLVGAIGNSKPYDGTTAATVTLTDDVFAGDQVSLTHAPANFASAAVGNGKTITVPGIQITGGADSGNYVLVNGSTTTAANIDADAAAAVVIPFADTWSLEPQVPQPLTPTMLPDALAPSVAEPAASTLDLALPSGFGGTVRSAGNAPPGNTPSVANIGGTAAQDDAQITVAMVRPATTELAGTVSVSVPEEMVLSGKGFSFPLPAEVVDAAAGENLQITQQNGAPLPSWLQCGPVNNRCSANGVPSGALPMQLLVSTGTQHWTLMLSERKGR